MWSTWMLLDVEIDDVTDDVTCVGDPEGPRFDS